MSPSGNGGDYAPPSPGTTTVDDTEQSPPVASDSPSSGGQASRPGRGSGTRQDEPTVRDILVIGPSASGKTLLLAALPDACASVRSGEPEILFTQTNLEPLVAARREGHYVRENLKATIGRETYHFSTDVVVDHEENGGPRSLGSVTYACMDGPGGALFKDYSRKGEESSEMKIFHQEMVAAGRTASSLVIVINAMTEKKDLSISNNLTNLFGEMAVRTEMPVPPPTQSANNWWQRTLWTKQPQASAPPHPPGIGLKLSADRVLIVMNRFDQVCTAWKRKWEQQNKPDAALSPYRIALEYADPVQLAVDVLKKKPLQTMRAYLKPGAKLAVAVTSAGGFVDIETTGDPFLDSFGKPNTLNGIPPERILDHLELFGLREVLLFAGYGITTPGVVELIRYEDLVEKTESRR